MGKVSVRHGIARAYAFLFGRLLTVIGVTWLPAVLYAVAASFLVQHMNSAMRVAVPSEAGVLGEYAFFYFAGLLVLTAFFGALIGIALAQSALGLRSEPVVARLVVGPREGRLFFALLCFYAVVIGALLVLTLAAGFGVTTASQYAATHNMRFDWLGVPFQVWLNGFAGAAAAILFVLLTVRFGFLLGPLAASGKKALLTRARVVSAGNFVRLAIVYLTVGLPAFALLAVCERAFGGFDIGWAGGTKISFSIEPGGLAAFGAILAGGLVVLHALFAGASAAAYEQLGDAAEPAAAQEPVFALHESAAAAAFADMRARDSGSARPGDQRATMMRDGIAPRAEPVAREPVFAETPARVTEHIAPVEEQDLRAQPGVMQTETPVQAVAPAAEEAVPVEQAASGASEIQPAAEHADLVALADVAEAHAELAPAAELPPLDPAGAISASPQPEVTPPG
jgi:hypothetical protein